MARIESEITKQKSKIELNQPSSKIESSETIRTHTPMTSIEITAYHLSAEWVLRE